ncbi:hypothetical protein FRB93_010607 [Tulasnella sp. JGI-2019a]|nr:hypothetical protein FRB93_010607 [Tulasnella sp. JGI-2019a]
MVYSRNVTVWCPSKTPPEIVGGFYQHGNVSIATLHNWLQIVLVTTDSWHLFYSDENGEQATRPDPLDSESAEPLPLGHYVVLSIGAYVSWI